MTERIDHAAIARMLIESVPENEDTARASAVALTALVDATLALVEQQRIANLLALGVIFTQGGQVVSEDRPDIALDVRGELGL